MNMENNHILNTDYFMYKVNITMKYILLGYAYNQLIAMYLNLNKYILAMIFNFIHKKFN